METKTNVRMYTVISVYKSKEKRTMKFVELTSEQFEMVFSKEIVNEFSHISTFPSIYSKKSRKIGIISVEKMTIGSTEKIVVEL